MEEQIECIIYNLKKCKIKHLDIYPNGRNICINNKGIISLIDFDIASIDNNYKSEKIKNRANEYDKDDYYIKFKKQLISIISQFMKQADITYFYSDLYFSHIFSLLDFFISIISYIYRLIYVYLK